MRGKVEELVGLGARPPREVRMPASIDELADVIGAYGRAGGTCGSLAQAISFTPLVQTDDVLISLAGLQGITSDETAGTATVLGGTPLKVLGEELLERGVAQENLGDIDVQSITGAFSTGTHGTGAASARSLPRSRVDARDGFGRGAGMLARA